MIMPTLTIMDGAMGSELQRRGYETLLPLWSSDANFKAPDLVRQIHEDYLKAGAQITTTNTFSTQKRRWARVGREKEAFECIRRAVDIARTANAAIAPEALVAGCIAPLEQCYKPQDVPSNPELITEHSEEIALYQKLGVDILLFETINHGREATVMAQLAHEAGIPFWMAFVTLPDGRLLSGETLTDVVQKITPYNPQALLINCRAPLTVDTGVAELAKAYTGTKGAYANGDGEPGSDQGWKFSTSVTPAEYLQHAQKWVKMGCTIIGGCCGTTPEHIQKLSQIL